MSDLTPQETAPTESSQDQTPAQAAPSEALSEDVVKNHPLYKELEGKHSAEERDKLRYKGRLEKVQKGFSEDEEVKPQPKKDDSPYATKEELWEIRNAKDLDVYADDKYKGDIEAGIPRDYALENAKLRFQANPDKARLDRQKSMSTGSSSGVRNLEAANLEGFNEEDAKRWNYSKETWLKQQQLKKARGQ